MSAGRFDHILVVDWSARATPSPKAPTKDAIFMAHSAYGASPQVTYHRTRADAIAVLEQVMTDTLARDERILATFDFSFAYPAGFARHLTGKADALSVWPLFAQMVEDGPDNANNRFDVARALNRRFPGVGPFWCVPKTQACPDLPVRDLRYGHNLPERRKVELAYGKMQPGWKLYTMGSVGSQAILGIARLHSLRGRFGPALAMAPYEAIERPIVLAECWPSLMAKEIAHYAQAGEIPDAAQVRVLAAGLAALAPDDLAKMLADGDAEEGGVLGAGYEALLRAAIHATLGR
ncbi:molybdopterin guanine dinucleotide synthesis [Rhodobacterales bacterium LSUCC0387]|nr:molybdopterin guanine dinucleotide synthesis [Rhodobacterales bacterium LSUCC0387]